MAYKMYYHQGEAFALPMSEAGEIVKVYREWQAGDIPDGIAPRYVLRADGTRLAVHFWDEREVWYSGRPWDDREFCASLDLTPSRIEMNQIPTPTLYVVVVDDSALLVGLHALDADDTHSSVTGAHGRIAKETLSEDEARNLYRKYLENGYRRDGGIE